MHCVLRLTISILDCSARDHGRRSRCGQDCSARRAEYLISRNALTTLNAGWFRLERRFNLVDEGSAGHAKQIIGTGLSAAGKADASRQRASESELRTQD